MNHTNGRRDTEGARPAWRPIPAWQWTLAAAAAVVIVAVAVIIWLLTIAGHAAPGTDQANARLNAVRTGLAAGAGAGAAVGLMLAFRRQHHQEVATVLTDLDATERRITELYTKAVEQLGSDKAPVRLGGVYALERLAQDNPAHRQTIVNVICAYLRMPFSLTLPASQPDSEATEEQGEPATETEAKADGIGDSWQQERQVRLTAQRILSDHLRDDRAKEKRSTDPPNPLFWPGMRLDLAGATLMAFSLECGVMMYANFGGATFGGTAWFLQATFGGGAEFDGATFSGGANFGGAAFGGDARFGGATFDGDARFGRATFDGDARFDGATFRGYAGFGQAAFNGDAESRGVFATIDDRFFEETFNFDEATSAQRFFRRVAWFDRATFSGDVWFAGAIFDGGAESLSFKQSHVLSSDARHRWPTGWCMGPDGRGGYTVVRENDNGRS